MTRWFSGIFLGLLVACGGKSASTTPEPTVSADSVWRAGETAFRRGKWSDAQQAFERYLGLVRTDDVSAAKARFFMGEIQLAQGNAILASRDFRRVADEGVDESLAPEALLRAGDAYAELWRKPQLDPSFGTTAIATYQEVQSRYPRSAAAAKAQARVTELQERLAYKTYQSGLYYFRLKAYDSAIIYFRDLVATYPRSPTAPEALVKMVTAYRAIGYKEEIRETCGYMRRFHPDAPGVAEVCEDVPTSG